MMWKGRDEKFRRWSYAVHPIDENSPFIYTLCICKYKYLYCILQFRSKIIGCVIFILYLDGNLNVVERKS